MAMPKLLNKLEIERCPHCGVAKPHMALHWQAGISSHSGVIRQWKAYGCQSCGGVVLACANQDAADCTNIYPSAVKEIFELEYLPEEVAENFAEALDCYSISRFNAFAAMCRRCIQSVCSELGAKGKDRVQRQLKDLKDMAEIDEETFKVLKQIIISGHDGAHPHLPKLSTERAGVLLELMKDVLHQLLVRKAKLQEAITLREQTLTQPTKTQSTVVAPEEIPKTE